MVLFSHIQNIHEINQSVHFISDIEACLYRHWCQYILHLQFVHCCRQRHIKVATSGRTQHIHNIWHEIDYHLDVMCMTKRTYSEQLWSTQKKLWAFFCIMFKVLLLRIEIIVICNWIILPDILCITIFKYILQYNIKFYWFL